MKLKTQQSPVVLYFCFRKSRPGKSRASPDPIVVENVFRSHENSNPAFSNSSGLDRRPKRRKEAVCVYKFLRESVDGQSGSNYDVTEHYQTRVCNEQTKGCAIVLSKPLYIS